MELERAFPIWEQLTDDERAILSQSAIRRTAAKGALLHSGGADCPGLFLICSGQLRAFILSDEGREVTVYRLFAGDVCLFSATCLMRDIRFDISIEAEKDAAFYVIPTAVFQALSERSVVVANYTNRLMAARFSEVMWLIEQVMWKSVDRRLAAFLLAESAVEGGDTLLITHETVARHMGSAREVITRMLRYFQDEGMVKLARGRIELADRARLQALAE